MGPNQGRISMQTFEVIWPSAKNRIETVTPGRVALITQCHILIQTSVTFHTTGSWQLCGWCTVGRNSSCDLPNSCEWRFEGSIDFVNWRGISKYSMDNHGTWLFWHSSQEIYENLNCFNFITLKKVTCLTQFIKLFMTLKSSPSSTASIQFCWFNIINGTFP